jgi:hypothetical protein
MAIWEAPHRSICPKGHSLLDEGAILKGKKRRWCRLCYEARQAQSQTAKRASQRAVNLP